MAGNMPVPQLPTLSPSRNLFVGILKSQAKAIGIVEEFSLRKHYGVTSWSEEVGFVQEATTISSSSQGMISIKVEETYPNLAARIASFFASYLDRRLTSDELPLLPPCGGARLWERE